MTSKNKPKKFKPKYDYLIETRPDGKGTVIYYGDNFEDAEEFAIESSCGFIIRYENHGKGEFGDPKCVGWACCDKGLMHVNQFRGDPDMVAWLLMHGYTNIPENGVFQRRKQTETLADQRGH